MNRNHQARGYDESFYGSHIAYHFMIGTDGTVKQLRSLSERTGHTRNQPVNLESIAIVVNGDFSKEQPTREQKLAIKALVAKLDSLFHFERITGHREASPTSCPGKFLEDALYGMDIFRKADMGENYNISRYYSPEPGQPRYFRSKPVSGTSALLYNPYIADVKVNCGLYSAKDKVKLTAEGHTFDSNGIMEDGTAGDCVNAAGGPLRSEEAFKVVACPGDDPKTPQEEGFPLGTRFHIEGIGNVTCKDRGGAIKGKRLDLWTGFGTVGLYNILSSNRGAGVHSVTVLP